MLSSMNLPLEMIPYSVSLSGLFSSKKDIAVFLISQRKISKVTLLAALAIPWNLPWNTQ